jgi:endonuclease YncB( thermonuclease family)
VRRIQAKRTIYSLITLAIAVFVLVAQQFGWFDAITQEAVEQQPGLYTVSRFVDGDTITVAMNGKNETIRMIGIDTPETHKPNAPVQCYGPAASAYMKNLIGNNKVRLEADQKSTNRDRYDRLLRYVYLPDGRLTALESIQNGYGFAYTDFPFTKSDEFVKAHQAAKAAGKGLWSNCQPFQMANGRWQTNNAQ